MFEHLREEGESRWAVFADLAFLTVLLVVLEVLNQYSRIATLEVLERRQKEIRNLIQTSLPPELMGSVQIVGEGSQHQRITFSSDALFAECDVELTARGEHAVRWLGEVLATKQEYFESVTVEGHTDVRPPRGPPSCPVEDNWELSARRAVEVVRLLAGGTGLRPELLSSTGRGQYHPSVGADTLDYDRNRRIEIVLRYTEKGLLMRAGPDGNQRRP